MVIYWISLILETESRNYGHEHGCQSIAEMADYLEVTEEFLHEALSHYKRKYGLSTNIDRYIIYFEPTLLIGKID